jgi:hypothetical protein
MEIEKIVDVLKSKTLEEIYTKMKNSWFDKYIPGIKMLCDCSQGNRKHFEGDAGMHTAHVIVNLREVLKKDPLSNIDEWDFIAALLHDVAKPETRVEDADGNVSFPNHEELAAEQIDKIAEKFNLNLNAKQKLYFLVKFHGDANCLPSVNKELQKKIVLSPYWRNMRILQEADAKSCYLNSDGSEYPTVYWSLFEQLRFEYL